MSLNERDRTKRNVDIRDFVQAAIGVAVQKPDEVLVASAQQSSAILGFVDRYLPSAAGLTEGIALLHTFVLVLGVGLLVGTSMSTGLFIAVFAVLGVAGGLFAVGALFTSLGINFSGFSDAMTTALGTVVSHRYLSDFYVLLPLLVLALGVTRWKFGAAIIERRRATTARNALRHYCAFCGSVMAPAARRCGSCKREIPKFSKNYCSECGKPAAEGAVYCWFCGEEVRRDGDEECPACKKSVPRTKFCAHCGSRLSWPAEPREA
jgi:Double zinc ribbon